MQYADDVALADALGRTQRYISARVEFDWNRNGRFDHAYSNLSSIVTHIESDRQMTGDLPESVNTMVGYSSAEMACTLAGRRGADEFSAPALFSPYEPNSPLYNKQVPGTPVRYSRVVQTDGGERVVRQFTGWVRSLDISRDTMEVKVTAQDNVDIAQSSVTLPRWARIATGNGAAWRPMDTTWVVEEVLRQSGRPTGPVARNDCVVYVTCNGGFLPSVGHVGDDYQIPLRRQYITNDLGEPFSVNDGPYGVYPMKNLGAGGGNGFDPNHRSGANITAARPIDVDTGQACRVGIGMWAWSDGASAGYFGDYFNLAAFQLEDWPRNGAPNIADTFHQNGAFTFAVYANGTMDVTVFENALRSDSDRRHWHWRRTTPLSRGWHYVNAQANFATNQVTATVWVDDEQVGLTTVNAPGGRYRRYTIVGGEWGRSNLCQVIVNHYAQHIQVYAGFWNGSNYRPGQQHAPTTADGMPLARTTPSLAELAWVPDVTMRHGWTVLQELANAEFGVVYTDEYGVINYVSHPFLRLDAEASAKAPLKISDDTLLGFTVNPTNDQYRNAISMSYSDRWATRALVWKAENAWDYWTYATSSPNFYDVYLDDDVISVFCFNLPRITNAQAQNGGEDIYTGGVSAITWTGITQFPTTTAVAPGAWSATTFASGVPRRFQLQTVSPAAQATFAFLPGNEAALFQGGTRYSADKYRREMFRDDAEVAKRGEHLLELGDNPWRQTRPTAVAISRELLTDTTVPAPLIDGVSIPSDPRLQLRDIVRIQSEGGVTESLFAQVIGITRTDSVNDGSVDKLTMRVMVTPGEWILDDPTLSVLDDTTILA